LLITCATWTGPVSAEDAPPPPPGPPLEKLFAPLREQLSASSLPPFLRDLDLRVHFRTYYFNRNKPDDSKNEALASGGWIGLQSGWLLDTFAMGATFTVPRRSMHRMTEARSCSSPGRRATTFQARRGARCATRSTRCSRVTVSWSTRRTSTRRTTG
jgi:hypothetical protein